MATISRTRLSEIDSIKFTILDPNHKNGVWESVSSTEVRLKADVKIRKEAVQEIAKRDFDRVWAILQEARLDPTRYKTLLIVIGAVAGSLVLAVIVWFIYFNAQFSIYQDDQYKFTIKYPKTWKVVTHPRANVAVVFLRPKDTVLDTVQENFNVTIQPVPVNITTLDEFSDTVKKQMTTVFGKSINIVMDRPLEWGWHEGHMMIIEAPKPDHLKMVNAWVLQDNQSYIMTFLGDMSKYAQDALLVNVMIRSLQLSN